MEDDDPLWKEILTSEILWVIVAALVILAVAFHLATSGSSPEVPR
jgi:hypothetical protein